MSFSFKDNRRFGPGRDEPGSRGESLAGSFLESRGYRLVAANFSAPIGRNNQGATVTGEIDLIALDGQTLCFIEVKSRDHAGTVDPTAAVDLRKQRQITRTARAYRRIFGVSGMDHRFDVVSVVFPASGEPAIELFKGFWTEARFAKRRWNDGMYSDIA